MITRRLIIFTSIKFFFKFPQHKSQFWEQKTDVAAAMILSFFFETKNTRKRGSGVISKNDLKSQIKLEHFLNSLNSGFTDGGIDYRLGLRLFLAST